MWFHRCRDRFARSIAAAWFIAAAAAAQTIPFEPPEGACVPRFQGIGEAIPRPLIQDRSGGGFVKPGVQQPQIRALDFEPYPSALLVTPWAGNVLPAGDGIALDLTLGSSGRASECFIQIVPTWIVPSFWGQYAGGYAPLLIATVPPSSPLVGTTVWCQWIAVVDVGRYEFPRVYRPALMVSDVLALRL